MQWGGGLGNDGAGEWTAIRSRKEGSDLTFHLLFILIHCLTGGVGMFLQMFSSSAVQVTNVSPSLAQTQQSRCAC